MKTAIAIGYASLDYPVILDGNFKGEHTVMIKSRPHEAFPRPGGSPRYVARSLANASVQTSVITWVGRDEMGELFSNYIKADGVKSDGIAVVEPGSTPLCLMLYQPDGSCGCCFDPGFMGRETLTTAQSELIQKTDLICFTVGPAEIGLQALSLVREETIVAWVAKNDPLSYSEELRKELGKRADYIFCNVHERAWVDAALKNREKPPPLIIRTQGDGDVLVCADKEQTSLSIESQAVNDTCGAGDTFAGGCLAAVMNGEDNPVAIARVGINAAQMMLLQRIESSW